MSLCIDDRLVCRFGACTPNGHLYRVTYNRCRIDTINSLDDGHIDCPKHVENRNKHTEKKLCVKLVIYKDYKLWNLFP